MSLGTEVFARRSLLLRPILAWLMEDAAAVR